MSTGDFDDNYYKKHFGNAIYVSPLLPETVPEPWVELIKALEERIDALEKKVESHEKLNSSTRTSNSLHTPLFGN